MRNYSYLSSHDTCRYGSTYWDTKQNHHSSETNPCTSQWKDPLFHDHENRCCSSLAWSWDRYVYTHTNLLIAMMQIYFSFQMEY